MSVCGWSSCQCVGGPHLAVSVVQDVKDSDGGGGVRVKRWRQQQEASSTDPDHRVESAPHKVESAPHKVESAPHKAAEVSSNEADGSR